MSRQHTSTKSGKSWKKDSKDAEDASELIPDKKVGRGRNGGPGRFEKPIKFKLNEVFSPGSKKAKYGGYSLAIKLGLEHSELLWDIAYRNGADLALYGQDEDILYLNVKTLSEKLRGDMKDGPMMLKVQFDVVRTYLKEDDIVMLGLKLIGLKKLRDADEYEDEGPIELD